MSRIKIKYGNFEYEYEGTDEFIKTESESIIKNALAILNSHSGQNGSNQNSGFDFVDNGDESIKLTTENIAIKINASSGTDLALAAAAHLTFVKNMVSFSRKDLLNEMQGARSFYNENYRKNLSAILKTLIKEDKLNEPTKNNYAMVAKERSRMKDDLLK